MLTEVSIAAAIVSVCLIIHFAGIFLMAEWLLRRREFLGNAGRKQFGMLMVVVFAGILVLHLIQTSLWAVFYYTQNLFSDFETSLYFSMVSFTTVGYGDVLLPRRWLISAQGWRLRQAWENERKESKTLKALGMCG